MYSYGYYIMCTLLLTMC